MTIRNSRTQLEILGRLLGSSFLGRPDAERRPYHIAKVLGKYRKERPRVQSVCKSLDSLESKGYIESLDGSFFITYAGTLRFWADFISWAGEGQAHDLAARLLERKPVFA